MNRTLLYGLLAVSVAACAARPVYTPRLPCPDLPLLSDNATPDQVLAHDEKIVTMYGECRKARRVNPKAVKP